MERKTSGYHRRVSEGNRSAILSAAAELFLEQGYDRTPLIRVAERAGVSRATLFKQFPTKAELFESTVLKAGDAESPQAPLTVPADPLRGLVVLGNAYSDLLVRPGIAGLMRTIIAESPRFPELQDRTFDFGMLPVLQRLRDYLRELQRDGHIDAADLETVVTQFLGMIASATFWPTLIHGTWSIADDERKMVVKEAAKTIVARYGVVA